MTGVKLDQLYRYALLFDAPEHIQKSILNDTDVSEESVRICQIATQLALGGHTKHEKRTAVQSVFSILQLARQYAPHPGYLPVEALNFESEKFIYPQQAPPALDESIVWQRFIHDYNKFNFNSGSRQEAESIFQLLHKHVTTLTCGYTNYPTVSFYELARLRAGMAVALALSENPDQVQLIGGDVSGIQRFLYEIVSKYASRNLKGRSFYLYMLVNNIIGHLSKRLSLYGASVAYDSGGKFLLIAPANTHTQKELDTFRQQFQEDLFKTHRTALSCWFGSEPLSLKSQLKDVLHSIKNQQESAKQQPYLTQVLDYKRLFDPQIVENGGLQVRDEITGEEIHDDELKSTWLFDKTGGKDIAKNTNISIPNEDSVGLITRATGWQIILGQRLKNFAYWIKSEEELTELSDLYIQKNVHIQLLNLGTYNYLLSEEDFKRKAKQLRDKTITVLAINDFKIPTEYGRSWSWQFHLYGGNEGPTIELSGRSVPMTFSEMAGGIEEDRIDRGGDVYEQRELAFKRLGVLRMDVDNLGQIFLKGIPKEKYCLATYCTLSRAMDYFFKGHLNQLYRSESERLGASQIIYAGGDDLFLLGHWDVVYRFAFAIKNAFARWTCHHPQLSISGGMVVVTQKYPVMKAASKAGVAEDTSKGYQLTLPTKSYKKNAFTIFDQPNRWSKIEGNPNQWTDEFALVQQLQTALLEQLELGDQKGGEGNRKSGLPMSTLRHITALYNMQHGIDQRNPYAWQWQAAYTFGQMKKRLAKQRAYTAERLITQLRNGILTGKFFDKQYRNAADSLLLLRFVARLTELQRRTNKARTDNN